MKNVDSKFYFAEWDHEKEQAELYHSDELYGEIELCRLDPDDLDEEIEELIEDVEDASDGDKDTVLAFLRNSKVMFVIRVLWQG